ncbi:FUSC family protein [Synechococcus sp. UW179B]|uniref:FUSC family protein n=1 Tax=Synechococcus sp. UW179B TaxID=2575516 RepID=UPI000E0E10A8|nr:FUSC family protein [Synechococcus sp. UW179B]
MLGHNHHPQQSKRHHEQHPWLTRQDLRLAVVTGLSAGLGLLSPIPYGYYLPLTTTAVLASTYGNSMRLGIQRLLGSLMGVIVLIIFTRGLELPLPLGLGLALATTRLFGGILGLQVGYKVAGNIIVMGWLVHEQVETVWGPIRLFWTGLGIVISLWASQSIWPSRSIPALHQQFASLLAAIEQELSTESRRLKDDSISARSPKQQQANRISLQTQLNAARQQQAMAQMELGVNPEQHPLHELWSSIDLLASQLLTSLWAIRSLSAPIQKPEKIKQLHQKEAELLDILCKQILTISSELRSPKTISYQKLNPQAMLKIKNLSCDYGQWLEQTTHDHLANEHSQISKQRLRQIILRVTLIDYIRSAIIEAVSIPSMTAISNKS